MNHLTNKKCTKQQPRSVRPSFLLLVTAGICVTQTACSIFPNCAEYSFFQDRMQDCVNQDVTCFTQTYGGAQLNDTVQLAKNNLLYKYSLSAPPAYDGDIYHSCKVDLTVNGETGRMISGSWNGDCDHWSRCVRYE